MKTATILHLKGAALSALQSVGRAIHRDIPAPADIPIQEGPKIPEIPSMKEAPVGAFLAQDFRTIACRLAQAAPDRETYSIEIAGYRTKYENLLNQNKRDEQAKICQIDLHCIGIDGFSPVANAQLAYYRRNAEASIKAIEDELALCAKDQGAFKAVMAQFSAGFHAGIRMAILSEALLNGRRA